MAAWTYYKAVRLFGGSYFHYADTERTKADLIEALDERRAKQ